MRSPFADNIWPILKLSVFIFLSAFFSSCCRQGDRAGIDGLRDCLDSLATSSNGVVGVAVITPDGDTLTVNNDVRFPLMSVFKLHEAIAVAHETDRINHSFDSLLTISHPELSSDTWSPMLKDYPEGDFEISVGDLVKYMLLVSDNNASNVLFERIVSVGLTDSLIRALDMPHSFELRFTEHEMQADHTKSYQNWSSPLACAALVRAVMNDSLVSSVKQDSIRSWLGQCTSANGRMAAAVAKIPDARLYHRTGSGYVNERGEIIAVNDVGVISLPDGRLITIAILIKDYAGDQEDADAEIAAITSAIADYFIATDRQT